MKTKYSVNIPNLIFNTPELVRLGSITGLPVRKTIIGLLYVCDDDGWLEWNPKAIQKAMKGVLIRGNPEKTMNLLSENGYLEYHPQTKDKPALGRIPNRYREV
ncbi:hypothetical protein ACH42_17245 [Endozoicomonas sp. (ex Bugula neritina AB1)]|nr:hypothetical protein ACH42_17245 [Endozoicomonas sp. (ex Bugula neritina AB1)]